MAKRKGQKDKQHNDQNKKDRGTSNTMAKRKGQKEKQHNGLKKRDKDLQNTTQKTKTKMQHNVLSAILYD
jgi:hypothetical protein